ncbi:MAG TPA: hypothetical protein VIM75_18260 [Ohtaekwangia sp.]|uniref:hypothetical protein n=1 Tax=Ohtaekwangia sp. TaxID=2066019 RepID=UPI002F95BD3F
MKQSESQKIQNLKTRVIYSALGIGTATGLLLLMRHFYRRWQANRTEKHSLEEGAPAMYATQLKMAFDNDMPYGLGTDEEAVIKVFESLPSKQMYKRVQEAYSRMNDGRNLNADLKDELDSKDLNKVMRILNSKK